MGDAVIPLTGAGEDDLPQPGSMGSNLEQARTGAPAQHCQQAPGSPPSVTWQTPAHLASHTQAHFPTPQTPSSSPGVETQRGKWEPSLPYAGGPRPPQVGTKAGDLQEGMGEPQAIWDTCHLPTWVLPAQVLRNRRMPQKRGTVTDHCQPWNRTYPTLWDLAATGKGLLGLELTCPGLWPARVLLPGVCSSSPTQGCL